MRKLLIIATMFLLSCGGRISNEKEIASLFNRTIYFDGNYKCYSMGNKLPQIDGLNRDFKIVTYIDSAFCSGCSLKILKDWELLLKDIPDSLASFVVFINSSDINGLTISLKTLEFNLPVVFDSGGIFLKKNKLEDIRVLNRTFLLDAQNKIVLAGEPLGRDKLWKLYKKSIMGL